MSSKRAALNLHGSGRSAWLRRRALRLVCEWPGCTAASLAGREAVPGSRDEVEIAIDLRKRLPELEDRGLVHGVEDETGATDVRWYAGRDADEAERLRASVAELEREP